MPSLSPLWPSGDPISVYEPILDAPSAGFFGLSAVVLNWVLLSRPVDLCDWTRKALLAAVALAVLLLLLCVDFGAGVFGFPVSVAGVVVDGATPTDLDRDRAVFIVDMAFYFHRRPSFFSCCCMS